MAAQVKQNVPNYIQLKLCDELYQLLAREADRLGVAMIDVAVRALAKQFKRPDLGYVPRKPQGRKRSKPLSAQ